MKRLVFACLCSLGLATSVSAQDDPLSGPACSDYMNMDRTSRMGVVEDMAKTYMADPDADNDSPLAIGTAYDFLATTAADACEAHADGSVGEALDMMSGN